MPIAVSVRSRSPASWMVAPSEECSRCLDSVCERDDGTKDLDPLRQAVERHVCS